MILISENKKYILPDNYDVFELDDGYDRDGGKNKKGDIVKEVYLATQEEKSKYDFINHIDEIMVCLLHRYVKAKYTIQIFVAELIKDDANVKTLIGIDEYYKILDVINDSLSKSKSSKPDANFNYSNIFKNDKNLFGDIEKKFDSVFSQTQHPPQHIAKN